MTASHTPLKSILPLWDFALAFYAQPQVSETCLWLQDTHNANVCVLIGLRWLDEQARWLSKQEREALMNHVQVWMSRVVEPLRSLRRQLKHPLGDYSQDDLQAQLRTQLKQAELLAEEKLLLEIERWSSGIAIAPTQCALTNVEAYLTPLGASRAMLALLQKPF